jgi:hypothetical protein
MYASKAAIMRLHHDGSLINRTSAIAPSNAALPAAAWYLPFNLFFVFSLAERKSEKQKEEKYRCE